jgi:hypothetical protein
VSMDLPPHQSRHYKVTLGSGQQRKVLKAYQYGRSRRRTTKKDLLELEIDRCPQDTGASSLHWREVSQDLYHRNSYRG